MACNVFGTPVTNETLKGMPEYHGKELTQIDRARVALELKNAEGKDANAHKYADYIRGLYGDGARCITLGFIYNATGGPLTYADSTDWNGHLCHSPYPFIIANGQWGVFGHGDWEDDYSKGVVAYAGKGSSGETRHWVLYWANNKRASGDHNRVRTDIHWPKSNYDSKGELDTAPSKRLTHTAQNNSGVMFGSMGDDKIAFLEAIMTLPEALPK